MRISRSWLLDYVDVEDLSTEAFAELVTTKIAEIDGVELVGAGLESAVAAFIKKTAPHPVKDNLSIATVEIGGEQLDVVCGAPNCRQGIFVPFVPPGTELRDSTGALRRVESREVYGVMSKGMLCSELELQIGGDHSGLLELQGADLRPGAPLSGLVGLPDVVLVIDNKSLTHRPDLWSHLGFARELSAILRRPLKLNPDRFADDTAEGAELLRRLGSGSSNISIRIDPASKCRRFAGLEFSGVAVEPSPLWMRRRLYSIGAGVRNLLVDLSNYVMHDVGQPNHAYDIDLLRGQTIYVRMAREGEQFVGLDGVERSLCDEDVVIADDGGPVALGGVIGGQFSSILDTTTRLFLESANFDPVTLRHTTKRHALRTDASNRFEKSRSAYAVPLAVHRFSELLLKLQPQARIAGSVVDNFPIRPAAVQVPVNYDYLRGRLGADVSDKEMAGILEALGFRIRSEGSGLLCSVPYERATRDISIPDDLVEEIGRIYGYERIPETAPLIASTPQREGAVPAFENRVRDLLSAAGFSEVYNYSFMSREEAERLGYEGPDAVKLLNPIDSNSDLIRTTLVPGMLRFLANNYRYYSKILLFEIGRSYHLGRSKEHEALKFKEHRNTASLERRLVSIAYSSGLAEREAGAVAQPAVDQGADFYAAAGIIRRLGRLATKLEPQLRPLSAARSKHSSALNFEVLKSWMHPHRAASISLNGTAVGILAEVVPGARADLPPHSIVAEIDLELLCSKRSAAAEHFQPLPRYPESFFEISVVMPEPTEYSELDGLLRSASNPELLKSLEVVAVYRGKPLSSGEKSVSVRLSFGSQDRTLSSEEVTALQQAVISSIKESRFSLRG